MEEYIVFPLVIKYTNSSQNPENYINFPYMSILVQLGPSNLQPHRSQQMILTMF